MDTTTSPDHVKRREPSPAPDHRALFSRLAATMARRRRIVIGIWLVIVIAAAPLALTLTSALSGAGWDAKGTDAEKVRTELRNDFPALGAENPIVVYQQSTPIPSDPAALQSVIGALARGPRVDAVTDPLQVPADTGLISRDGRTALIPVQQQIGEDKDRPEAAGALASYVSSLPIPNGAQVEVTGEWPMWSDFNTMNEKALHLAELVSGVPTLIMLFIAFGALLAAGVPLILALAGIATGFAALHLLTFVSPMSVWSMNFSMMIGLAVGIGTFSLWHGYAKHHHRFEPLVLFYIGSAFLVTKQFFVQYENWLLAPAVILIIVAHVRNYRACRVHDHAHAEDCDH